jgi:hypothetical protein
MQIIETLENRKDAVKVSELARLLSVTPKHIYKTRAAGRIPGAFRVNRALRFDPQILAEWLKGELMPDVAASRGKQKRTRVGKDLSSPLIGTVVRDARLSG